MGAANATGLKRELFLSFAKIGLFTFGGGYAMISIIEAECVKRKNWITHDEMMDITVIAESTPGPIAINCATFVGYKRAGLFGAIAATLGIVLPSFLIIYLISLAFDDFLSVTLVAKAFRGIKAAVGLLILSAAFSMMKKMSKAALPRALMISSCLATLIAGALSLRLSSIHIMLASGAVSLALFIAKTSPKDEEDDSK